MLLLWNRPTYAHININNRRLVAIEVHLLFPLPHPIFILSLTLYFFHHPSRLLYVHISIYNRQNTTNQHTVDKTLQPTHKYATLRYVTLLFLPLRTVCTFSFAIAHDTLSKLTSLGIITLRFCRLLNLLFYSDLSLWQNYIQNLQSETYLP